MNESINKSNIQNITHDNNSSNKKKSFWKQNRKVFFKNIKKKLKYFIKIPGFIKPINSKSTIPKVIGAQYPPLQSNTWYIYFMIYYNLFF